MIKAYLLPYFYTSYHHLGSQLYDHTYWDVHLRVLRASPDGTTNKIDLGDWTGECREQNGQYTSSGTTVAPTVWHHPAVSVITNADTGAAIFADLYYMDACGSPTTPQTQASFVAQDAITSQVNVASTSFVPTLQREDGSYIGADGSGNVVALGQNGSVVWQQPIPGATPLYATSDGGAIVTDSATLYTLDQNGNVTSQTPDRGVEYSWKAAYTIGGDPTVQEVPPDFDLATIATTPGAVGGGNLTGNGFSLAHHTFGLVFCGPGPEGDGSCPSNITNMTFSYQPHPNNTNYTQACDFTQASACDSGMAHPEWAATIKNAALSAYVAAFANLPAIVSRGLWKPLPLSIGSNNPSFEHTVYIDGTWIQGPGNGCPPANGITYGGATTKVFYLSLMCGAQVTPLSSPAITDIAGEWRRRVPLSMSAIK